MIRFKRALRLLEEKRHDEARSLLELLLCENPSDPELQYNLGMLCTEMGDPRRAVELLDQCARTRPGFANVHVALGVAKYLLGDLEAARTHLSRALEIEPSNPYAHRNLGVVFGKQGDHTKALDHLQKAYAGLPDDPKVTLGLGLAYLETGDHEKADHFLKLVLDSKPPAEIAGPAKDGRRRIAQLAYDSSGSRPDAVMYCLDALERFSAMSESQVREVSFEIAQRGRQGFDVANPERQYRLRSLDGSFSGLHLVCLMYAGFKRFDPAVDIGFDLASEYAVAQSIFREGK